MDQGTTEDLCLVEVKSPNCVNNALEFGNLGLGPWRDLV